MITACAMNRGRPPCGSVHRAYLAYPALDGSLGGGEPHCRSAQSRYGVRRGRRSAAPPARSARLRAGPAARYLPGRIQRSRSDLALSTWNHAPGLPPAATPSIQSRWGVAGCHCLRYHATRAESSWTPITLGWANRASPRASRECPADAGLPDGMERPDDLCMAGMCVPEAADTTGATTDTTTRDLTEGTETMTAPTPGGPGVVGARGHRHVIDSARGSVRLPIVPGLTVFAAERSIRCSTTRGRGCEAALRSGGPAPWRSSC